MTNRAYSVFSLKSLDDDARTFEGIATTPITDRQDDIVEPKGAVFKLPIPMLWAHAKGEMKDPIGEVTSAKVTADGIFVKGYFAKLDHPPSLKEDLDRAWSTRQCQPSSRRRRRSCPWRQGQERGLLRPIGGCPLIILM